MALGWHPDQVVVIDDDLGQSAAEADRRPGFQRLVADVSLGLVGIVLSLEVSRLARNCSDWHRLLELCALGDTLILDEDGLYDPNLFNDRLILGLRGTMSEAELHFLRGPPGGRQAEQGPARRVADPAARRFAPRRRGADRAGPRPRGPGGPPLRLPHRSAAAGSAWMTVRRLSRSAGAAPGAGADGEGGRADPPGFRRRSVGSCTS